MRFLPASIAFVLCVVCAITGIRSFRTLLVPPDAVFVGPGEYHFHAPVAGDYTIWYQSSGVVEDEFKVAPSTLPLGARIRVESNGRTVPIVADAPTTSSTSGSEKRSVLRFTVAGPDEYLITTVGLEEKLAFEITHGPILRPLLIVMGAFGLAGILGVSTAVFLALALAGIFPKKPKQQASTPDGTPRG